MKRPHNTRRRFLAPWCRKAVEFSLEASAPNPEANPELAQEHRAKLIAALGEKPALYHCISRVVDKKKVLGVEEKEKFVEYMRIYERFCQVRILTYCVMSNHFHILVEVPEPPEDRGRSWSDEKFLRHVSCLYFGPEYEEIAQTLHRLRKQGAHAAAEEHRNQYFDRMWDLSQFMKTLKQRFVQWYNKEHGRVGSLWSERFKSLLVENGHAARMVAAYIDLNPVRAGIVEDPADYRWCGYSEAFHGYARAREGLWLVALDHLASTRNNEQAVGTATRWSNALEHYRRLLYVDGEESERDRERGRAGISPEKVAQVLSEGGNLNEAEMLRCRIKPFADGGAVGSESFIRSVFGLLYGPAHRSRRSGVKKIPNSATDLRVLRSVRKNAVSI